MKLAPLLKIQKGITAIIGGGGKTTLMHILARELSEDGTVIISTSTHIRASHLYQTLIDPLPEVIAAALACNKAVCITGVGENGKLTMPRTSFTELAKMADYVLVEADGSRGLPIKAHEEYEPVIPDQTDQVIYVMGVDGFGHKISDSCHRPDLYEEKTGISKEKILTPLTEACLRKIEDLGDRYYINKVETENDRNIARELAGYLDKPVVIGSLHKEEYECL